MKIFAFIVRLAFIFIVTALAWYSASLSIAFVAACILVAIQSKAGALIEISFGPLKAKLERDVSEAEKLVNSLKKLSLVQAKVALTATIRNGRFASHDDWDFRVLREVETSLRETGATDDDLKAAREEFLKFLVIDLVNCATGGSYIPSAHGPEVVAEYQAHNKTGAFRDPEFLAEWLEYRGLLTAERQMIIDDVRWILNHRDVRDREQYMRSKVPIAW